MEDAWEELGDTYENSKTKLIGEIDCTSDEAQELCKSMKVSSYPTLKFGDVNDLQEYEGPRDFTSLKKFADKQLKPTCGINHVQLCDKATRKEIRRLKALTLEELNKEIGYKENEMTKLDEYQEEFIAKLEDQYEKAMSEKDEKLKQLKEGDANLPLMKAVAAHRKIEIKPPKGRHVEQGEQNAKEYEEQRAKKKAELEEEPTAKEYEEMKKKMAQEEEAAERANSMGEEL